MSQFYADIQGSRGPATRQGGKESGIRGHIRGWDIGVRVEGTHGTVDAFHIHLTPGSNGNGGEVFLGTFTRQDLDRLNLEGGSAKMEEYIRDVISFCRMFYIGGIANVVLGRELQLDLAEKYPEKWMEILRDEAGEFTL